MTQPQEQLKKKRSVGISAEVPKGIYARFLKNFSKGFLKINMEDFLKKSMSEMSEENPKILEKSLEIFVTESLNEF